MMVGDGRDAAGTKEEAGVGDREDIPAALKRRLMIEAGHRCAIPSCRATAGLIFEHIRDYAIVRKHEFQNMIVICSNCHSRKGDRHGQIDRKALRQYKANLAVLNSRYSDVERRVLEVFAQHRASLPAEVDRKRSDAEFCWPAATAVELPNSLRIMVLYLIKDGLAEIATGPTKYLLPRGDGFLLLPSAINAYRQGVEYYRLTDKGVDFVGAWLGAQPLDAGEGSGEPVEPPA